MPKYRKRGAYFIWYPIEVFCWIQNLKSKATKHFQTLRGFYHYCSGNSSTIWSQDSDSDYVSDSAEFSGSSTPDIPVSQSVEHQSDIGESLYMLYFDYFIIAVIQFTAKNVNMHRNKILFLRHAGKYIRTFLIQDGELLILLFHMWNYCSYSFYVVASRF